MGLGCFGGLGEFGVLGFRVCGLSVFVVAGWFVLHLRFSGGLVRGLVCRLLLVCLGLIVWGFSLVQFGGFVWILRFRGWLWVGLGVVSFCVGCFVGSVMLLALMSVGDVRFGFDGLHSCLFGFWVALGFGFLFIGVLVVDWFVSLVRLVCLR